MRLSAQVSFARATFLLGKDHMGECVRELEEVLARIGRELPPYGEYHSRTIGGTSEIGTRARVSYDYAVVAVGEAKEATERHTEDSEPRLAERMIILVADALYQVAVASESHRRWEHFLLQRDEDRE